MGTALHPEDFRWGAAQSWGRVPEFSGFYSVRTGVSKLWPKDQVQPAACFDTALELRTVYTVFFAKWW